MGRYIRVCLPQPVASPPLSLPATTASFPHRSTALSESSSPSLPLRVAPLQSRRGTGPASTPPHTILAPCSLACMGEGRWGGTPPCHAPPASNDPSPSESALIRVISESHHSPPPVPAQAIPLSAQRHLRARLRHRRHRLRRRVRPLSPAALASSAEAPPLPPPRPSRGCRTAPPTRWAAPRRRAGPGRGGGRRRRGRGRRLGRWAGCLPGGCCGPAGKRARR